MKILTIVNNLGIGGTERAAQNFSIGYKDEKCEVQVLALNELGIRAKYLEENGIKVHDWKNEQTKSTHAISEWGPDIIHVHRSGVKCITSMQAIKTFKTPSNRVLETNVFARPDFSSDAQYIDLHLHLSKWCFWKWKKWTRSTSPKQIGTIIPYPIDVQRFSKHKDIQRRQFNLPLGSFILGRIGQPFDGKWNRILLDLLERLLQKDDSFYLVVVGLPKKLEQLLKNYSKITQEHTIILPLCKSDEELAALYKSFDIFVHAAEIGESFGMVLAEAMTFEIPIVTVSTPLKDNTQLELVQESEGGYVIDNIDEFQSIIEKLKDDSKLRATLGKNGKNYIENNFTTKIVVQKAINVAKIALASNSKAELLNNLNLQKVPVDIKNGEITRLLKNQNFNFNFLTKLKLYLIHHPVFFSAYLKIREKMSYP
jgi:glycosyltransferase involved in cell wall biosynthesis